MGYQIRDEETQRIAEELQEARKRDDDERVQELAAQWKARVRYELDELLKNGEQADARMNELSRHKNNESPYKIYKEAIALNRRLRELTSKSVELKRNIRSYIEEKKRMKR